MIVNTNEARISCHNFAKNANVVLEITLDGRKSGVLEMDLTDRQRRLYEVILAAATAGQVCPTNREIAVQSGLVSASAVADALGRLQRKGVVEVMRYNRARVVKFPGHGVETKRPPAASPAGYAPHWQYRKSNSEGLDKAVPKESVLPLRLVCGACRTVPTWRPSRCHSGFARNNRR